MYGVGSSRSEGLMLADTFTGCHGLMNSNIHLSNLTIISYLSLFFSQKYETLKSALRGVKEVANKIPF